METAEKLHGLQAVADYVTAEYGLHCTKDMVQRAVKLRRLASYNWGRELWFDVADVRSWVNSHKRVASNPPPFTTKGTAPFTKQKR